MSPSDKNVIQNKIARLERNINILKGYKNIPRSNFLSDFTINGATLHYLVESIEIIIDVGNHILAEEFALDAATYSDVIVKLGENKVVPQKFAEENMYMAKFRNRIIHIYNEIDLQEVYENLQKAPDIFRQFIVYYTEFARL